MYLTPEEVRLLHALMMGHVIGQIKSGELEPWESKLLTNMGKASARAVKTEPAHRQTTSEPSLKRNPGNGSELEAVGAPALS